MDTVCVLLRDDSSLEIRLVADFRWNLVWSTRANCAAAGCQAGRPWSRECRAELEIRMDEMGMDGAGAAGGRGRHLQRREY